MDVLFKISTDQISQLSLTKGLNHGNYNVYKLQSLTFEFSDGLRYPPPTTYSDEPNQPTLIPLDFNTVKIGVNGVIVSIQFFKDKVD